MDETSEPQTGDMGVPIEPKEPESDPSFKANIDYFPQDQRDEARSYDSINDRVMASFEQGLDAYNAITNFSHNLIAEKGRSYVQNCKLFHILIGSGLPRHKWENMPMDTPDGDYKRFIDEELIPLLEALEKRGFKE